MRPAAWPKLCSCRRARFHQCILGWMARISVLASLLAQGEAQLLLPLTVPSIYDGMVCGRVFRVAFHIAPPFIQVDAARCKDQKCPPEAFGSDGGLTYQFLMHEVRDALIQICKDRGDDPRIQFDWYLPAKDRTLESSPVEMVCQASFNPDPGASDFVNSSALNRCEHARYSFWNHV
jgi:hypothetical protein